MLPSATAAAFLPSSVVRSSISPVAILPIITAAPITSAGRFSPFGPRGMSLSPDNSFRFFGDLNGVPSDVDERNGGRLLYFVPENASRIFYVHKNRLLAHIGAFDPVHLRLLLCAKHTTGARRTRPSRANKFKLIRRADVTSDDQAAPTHPPTCETSFADSTDA